MDEREDGMEDRVEDGRIGGWQHRSSDRYVGGKVRGSRRDGK